MLALKLIACFAATIYTGIWIKNHDTKNDDVFRGFMIGMGLACVLIFIVRCI